MIFYDEWAKQELGERNERGNNMEMKTPEIDASYKFILETSLTKCGIGKNTTLTCCQLSMP